MAERWSFKSSSSSPVHLYVRLPHLRQLGLGGGCSPHWALNSIWDTDSRLAAPRSYTWSAVWQLSQAPSSSAPHRQIRPNGEINTIPGHNIPWPSSVLSSSLRLVRLQPRLHPGGKDYRISVVAVNTDGRHRRHTRSAPDHVHKRPETRPACYATLAGRSRGHHCPCPSLTHRSVIIGAIAGLLVYVAYTS